MKKTAFTLAEILATLTIIGVIAAITIPNLNQTSQNNQYVAGCLKSYSVLSQMVTKMKVANGPIGFGSLWTNEKELAKAMVEQLNVIDQSEDEATRSDVKSLKGEESTLSGMSFTTADGMIYYFSKDDCTGKGYVADDSTACLGSFAVDVNGLKGPNAYGKDIFFFGLIRGEGILPAGSYDGSSDCISGGAGVTCAAKVIKEKKLSYL